MSTETTVSLVAEMRERAFVHGESAIAAEIVRWAKRLEALEARREPVQAEVVGKVYGMEDGTFEVDWLLEGGIHAVGIDGDTYLYVLDIPAPEDGHVELFAAQRQEQEGGSHGG